MSASSWKFLMTAAIAHTALKVMAVEGTETTLFRRVHGNLALDPLQWGIHAEVGASRRKLHGL